MATENNKINKVDNFNIENFHFSVEKYAKTFTFLKNPQDLNIYVSKFQSLRPLNFHLLPKKK